MPKVSRWALDNKKVSLFKEDFWSALTLLEDKRKVRSFLTQFLTPTERLMMAKRFQVALMLLAGANYAAIKERLHVSEPTISKLSNQLADGQIETIAEMAEKILKLKGKRWIMSEMGPPKRRGVPGDLLTPLVKFGLDKAGTALFNRAKSRSASSPDLT